MEKRKLTLPLVVTGILIASAFVPVLQIILLSLNGGFLYLFEMILNMNEHSSLTDGMLTMSCYSS